MYVSGNGYLVIGYPPRVGGAVGFWRSVVYVDDALGGDDVRQALVQLRFSWAWISRCCVINVWKRSKKVQKCQKGNGRRGGINMA